MTNTAIVRKERRESIAFTGVPAAETCRKFRSSGWEYDRRTGQWYRKDVTGTTSNEQELLATLPA
jgi:hypothetical protein